MRAPPPSVAAGGLLAALICGCVSSLTGQSTPYAAVSVDNGSRATLVVIGARLPVGSVHDVVGLEGTAWLLGKTLAAQANAALSGDAGVTVDVGRSSTLFTLSALPDATLDSTSFERERTRLSSQVLFQSGSPALDSEGRVVQLVSSPSNPWARSPRGTRASLDALTIHDAQLLRRSKYSATSSVVAAVGLGDGEVARRESSAHRE